MGEQLHDLASCYVPGFIQTQNGGPPDCPILYPTHLRSTQLSPPAHMHHLRPASLGGIRSLVLMSLPASSVGWLPTNILDLTHSQENVQEAEENAHSDGLQEWNGSTVSRLNSDGLQGPLGSTASRLNSDGLQEQNGSRSYVS